MPHFHKSIVDYTHHAPYINTAKVCHQMPRCLLEYVRCPLLNQDVLHTKRKRNLSMIYTKSKSVVSVRHEERCIAFIGEFIGDKSEVLVLGGGREAGGYKMIGSDDTCLRCDEKGKNQVWRRGKVARALARGVRRD